MDRPNSRMRLTRDSEGEPVIADIEEARGLYEDLVQNMNDIDFQLTNRRDRIYTETEQTEYIDWKRRAIKAKNHLRRDLVTVKKWIRGHIDENGGIYDLATRMDVYLHVSDDTSGLLIDVHSFLGRCMANKGSGGGQKEEPQELVEVPGLQLVQ